MYSLITLVSIVAFLNSEICLVFCNPRQF
ncbi:hypothetical protein CAEBREN_18557 [Caenorhabditis brenneri]|uniref:Uncharacterized protein n=1 Tax=Caenorhabditis brenneri TaxID=135651 RepID=G0NJD0_CAEBE|nr:hypothetical protein CAEBREN_18557 [Caenorhabditis brenneri]